MSPNLRLKLVVFDWSGTVVDYGCQAPAAALLEAFAKHRIMLTMAQVRGSMGIERYEHVRSLLELPAVGDQFQIVHGRRWNEADALEIFHDLTPLQVHISQQHTDLTPHLIECVSELRRRGLKIGTTTSYPRETAELVWEAAAVQGFEPDGNVAADDTPAARPAPWMIFRVMQDLDVFPPACAVKVGDTVPDIEEGRNAGCWSLGVTSTSSELGLTPEQWAALSCEAQRTRLDAAARKLLDAGAHYVIPTLAELPATIDHIEARMETGERP